MALSYKHYESSTRLIDKRIQWLVIVEVGACVAVLAHVADPSNGRFFPPCPFHALTGLYCPGCGTTRALHQLSHGNIGAAMRLNPLALVLLPVLAYSFFSFTLEAFKGKALRRLFSTRPSMSLLIGTIVGFTILRNLPVYPFTLLAPRASIPR
jgi:Protein of unknown function (DUF2752)